MVKPDVKAVYQHDLINLLLIGIVLSLDLYYLYVASYSSSIFTNSYPGENASREFSWVYRAFVGYMIFDTIYVFLIPSSTASDPNTILIHHVATLIYSLVPCYAPRLSWHTAALLTVELNTFALTARRNVAKDTLPFHFFNVLFYLTWVVIRLIAFPVFVTIFFFEYQSRIKEEGPLNVVLLAVVFQGLLTLLSLLWTWQMVAKVKKEKV